MKQRRRIPAILVAVGIALGVAVYVDATHNASMIELGIEWEILGYNAQGELVAHHRIREGTPLGWFVITDVGFDDLIRKAVGQSSGQPAGAQWVAIGTGTTCSTASTGLASETARVAATYSEPASKQFRETATFSSVSGIQSAGAFNAGSGGVMLSCQTFSSITADTLEIRITYTLS